MQKFEDDCRKRRNEEIGGYGKPRSRWERLWDADEGKPYWHQWETRESVWDKPCICHVCDANIPEDDTMCFKCKNKRSEFNQKIYDDNHKKIDYAAFLAAVVWMTSLPNKNSRRRSSTSARWTTTTGRLRYTKGTSRNMWCS